MSSADLSTITAAAFPTSPLALRTTDLAAQARTARFSEQMAEAANTAARKLTADWRAAGTSTARRVGALRELHTALIGWRTELAALSGARVGVGTPLDPARFSMPVTSRNLDRIGYVGRLRDGARWDRDTRTYRGGRATPAHEAMIRFGIAAQRRFEAEASGAEVLQNWITLPDGSRLRGNVLLRGTAAEAAAAELAGRIAARGLDASQVETGGDPMYTKTPDPADADAIFHEALMLLADAECSMQGFRLGRYMLFQGPRTKKGSDAVSRVFSVAIGAVLYGPDAPQLRADEDLRAYVLGQHAATDPAADDADLAAR